MKRFALGLCGLLASACSPGLDPPAERVALAGPDLDARLSGKTLEITSTPDQFGGPVLARVELREDGTASLSIEDMTEQTRWQIIGQGLCFVNDGRAFDEDDCRTIGWIQGNRFAVFDTRGATPSKIADGIILDG